MKGENSKIKAVIFDIGGVLRKQDKTRFNRHDLHISGVHESFAKKLKIDIDDYFDSIDSYYGRSIEGQIDEKMLLSILSLNLNYPKSKIKNFYFKQYKKKYKRNNGLFSIAKKLKKQGVKIAILSDQWHLSKSALMPKQDLKIFDVVITSCDVGMRKPNPKIYEMILKKLRVKAEETIFIDNQPWNIIPANKLGFKTILFSNNKKIKEQLRKFGFRV